MNFTRVLILLFLLTSLSVNIFIRRNNFIQRYDLEYWQNQFSLSQVVIGDKAPYFFSDSELYSIVGYKYVTGTDPMTIHPEVPPAGKLIIGLSIVLFSNPVILFLAVYLIFLGLLYRLGRLVGLSPVASMVVLLFVSFDGLIWSAVTEPLLDLPQLLFLSLSLTAFVSAIRSGRGFLTALIAAGLMMATKFYLNGLLLIGVYTLVVALSGKFRLFIRFIFTLPAAAVGYASPYALSFLSGVGIGDFLRFSRWLTSWWAGNSRVPWGGIFSIVFSGRWLTWWGTREILPVPQWSVLWPATLIASVISFILIIVRRNLPLFTLWLWSLSYLSFISFSSAFPRYLIALLPFWYILTIYSLERTVSNH